MTTEPVDPEHDYRDHDELLRDVEAKLDELLSKDDPAPAAQPHEVDVDPWMRGWLGR